MARAGFNFEKLRRAVDWSLMQLQTPRKKRVEAIKQFVGHHYADSGSDRVVPVNMIELAATIYVRHLASRAPQVMVSTSVDHLRPFAKNMELALNQIPDEIGLARTLVRVVVEAIFGMGVAKVGICSSNNYLLGHDVGETFVDAVPLDDYFLDMSAKTREGIHFEGNDYWLDLEAAREIYEGRGSVEPDPHTVHGAQGEDRAEGISADEGAEVYRDRVHLRDVWLPQSQRVVTYGVTTQKVYRVVEWDGPERGPYHVLSFNDVPGNLLPLPPSALWIDLHNLANTLFRKLAKQAEGKKRVVAFAGGDEEGADRLKNASDGEGIKYNGQKPESIDVGGIDAPTLAFFLQTRDLFSYFSGNLDSLGGLSPVSDTGVQDRMIGEAASARMERMKALTVEFDRGIFESLAWYEWTDPLRKRTVKKPVEGTDMVLEAVWSEETREGDFLDYNLDVDPYSMQQDTPDLRLQKIGQVLERFVIPFLPLLQQQGVQVDFRKLVEVVSKLANLRELRELIAFAEPIPGDPQQGGSGSPSFKPANTHRTYERVNRPGATRAGKDDVLTRLLMGGGVQGSEASSIGRGVS